MAGLPVFSRFDIYHRMHGGTMLTWDLHPLFIQTAPAPFEFTVSASRPSTGDWYEIAAITDGFYYLVDPNRWVFAKDLRIHYRLTVTDGEGRTYDSESKQAFGVLSKQDALKAMAVIKKEKILLEKEAGTLGLLWKRRHWGEKCTECTDYDTGEPAGNRCLNCYDTGIVGGYFPPIEVWILLKDDAGRRMKQDDGLGTTENQAKIGRTHACPWLDTKDVWAVCSTDQRFIIQKVKPVEYRGVPLIFDPVELRLAQSSDIVYYLPREGDQSSSSNTG